MVFKRNSWKTPLVCNSYSAIKLGVSILLVSCAFRFLYNRSTGVSDTRLENANVLPPLIVSSNSQSIKDDILQVSANDCNLFVGDWVPSESGPLYTNETCSFIDEPQNCLANGRSDTGYLYWRWNPHGCELPRFDPKRFLESMRDKILGMIGDSISRNHVQSLLCMLSTVEKSVSIYHDESYRSRKWLFPSYNFTISLIWSPLLAKAALFEDSNGVSSSEIELHLDILDKTWTEQNTNFDYTIISIGGWFTKGAIYYENSTVIGCHICPKRNLTEIGMAFPHRKVIRNVYDHIISSNYKGTIIYRTTAPSHFENGDWNEGGTCKRSVPAKEGEFELNQYEKGFYDNEIEEFNRAKGKASENGVNLRLLDVAYLSSLRPDGHPGSNRYFEKLGKNDNGKAISDCLHWCVPGPIDYWNDLLMQMLVKGLIK